MLSGVFRGLVCVAGAGAALGLAPPAQAVTGQQLLEQCTILERGAVVSGDTVRLPRGEAAASCWVYMAAIQDLGATVEQEGGPSLLGACVPAETTRLQIVQAFTRYALAHRDALDLRATALIIPALIEAYPCPETQ